MRGLAPVKLAVSATAVGVRRAQPSPPVVHTCRRPGQGVGGGSAPALPARSRPGPVLAQIVDSVIPIFALIAIGWAAVTAGLLKRDIGEAISDFVFRLAVPVLMFRTIATGDYSGGSPWSLWTAYFTGVVVVWTVAHLIATRLLDRDARIGVVAGVSAGFANNVFIGLPLVSHTLGEAGTAAISILLAVHLPVMMIAGTLAMQRAERMVTGTAPQSIPALLATVLGNLARNPLVVGLACGILYRLAGLPLAGLPRIVVDQIAGIAGPAALLSMGMAMRKYGLSGNLTAAAVTSALKLFLLPAAVYAASALVGLSPVWTAAMVLTASVPTGVNAYLIANHFGVGHGLASSTITLTTAFGVVTVSFWALVLGV